MGFQHMDIPRNGKIFLWCTRTTAKMKELHQTLFELMGTRTCYDRYCIKQLWWHSVTTGLRDRHGVQTYGYIEKWEDFPGCSRATAKIKVLHQKRFILMGTRTCANPYCILLLWWYSVTNGLGVPHGVPTYGYTQKWEDFPVVCENNCQNESVSTNTFNSNGCKNLC